MPFGPITILDDRGRKIRLISFSGHSGNDDADLPVAIALLADRIDATPSRFLHILGAAMLVCVSIIALLFASFAFPIFPRWILIPAGGFAVWFAWALLTRAKRKSSAPIIVRALLGVGRCPSCGYRLQTANSEDALCTCSECAAAWECSRIGTATLPTSSYAYTPGLVTGNSLFHIWLRSWFRSPRVSDDHYHVVPTLPPSLPGMDAQVGKSEADRLRAAVAASTRLLRLLVCSVCVVIALAVLVVQAQRIVEKGTFDVSFENVGTLALVGILVVSGVWHSWTGRSVWAARRLVATLRSEGICPSCGLDLRPHPTNRSGCTICPRCAAVWKIPEKRSPA